MNVFVNLLANTIVNSYFIPTRCLYIFTDNSSTYEHRENTPVVILNVQSLWKNPNIYTNFYCSQFIVNTKTPKKTFEEVEHAIRFGDNRFNFRTYLILPTDDLEQNTTTVFETKSIDYVANVVAIYPENGMNDFVFNLYTHKYASLHNYNEVYLLDKWFSTNSSFMYKSNLYPDKLTNQGGRTLRIGTITYKPYSVTDYLDGTELSAILETVAKHNMTFTVVDFDGDWGDAYENFTGDGVLGNLARDNTDIGFASLFMYFSTYHYLDVTNPLVHTGITALVPAPKLESGWFTPFLSFSTSMWGATILSVIFCFWAILFVTSINSSMRRNGIFENTIVSMLRTEAVFLGNSLSNLPQDGNSRLVYALTMILGFVTATIYSSGLASNMTIPRYKGTIRTLEDLVNSGIHWGATSLVWVASISESENPIYQKIVGSFIVTDVQNLTELNCEEFAYAIERLQEGNYALGDYITEEGAKKRRIMDENLFTDYIVMYMRKGSILLPLINRMVLYISQAGLVQSWEYLAISKYSSTTLQTMVRFSAQPPKPVITPLKFSHVEGAFGLWALGMIISIVCFIFEIKKDMHLQAIVAHMHQICTGVASEINDVIKKKDKIPIIF